MAGQDSGDIDSKFEINLAPMVGVLAALLVMLIVSYPGKRGEADLNLLSGYPPPPPLVPPPTYEIKISASGGLTWNGEAISLDELDKRAAVAADMPSGGVFIIPDHLTRYRDVAHVMSVVRNQHLALAIENPHAKRPVTSP